MAKLIHTAGEKLSVLNPRTRYRLASLAALMLINAVVCHWLYQELAIDRDKQTLRQVSKEYAQRYALNMAGGLAQLNTQLRTASEESNLQQALINDDQASVDRINQQLRADIGELHSLYIATFNDNSPASLALSFAERDIIRRAARGEKVVPEANRVEDEWRVSLLQEVAPAKAEDDVASPLGILLLSVALDRVLPNTADGSLELLQMLPDGQLQLVLRRGIGADTTIVGEARVANSAFTLRFTPSDAVITTAHASRFPFIGAAVLSTILFAGLALAIAEVLSRMNARRTSWDEAHAGDEVLEHLLNLESQRKNRSSPEQPSRSTQTEDDPLDIQDVSAKQFPSHIFRAYDIRGVAHRELTAELVMQIGQAVGSEALATGKSRLIVARDGRLHSADISEQLIAGILSTGCHVSNIGLTPSPVLYFACHELEGHDSGVMVTASHNPSTDNGFKIVMGGEALRGEGIDELRQRIEAKDFSQGKGQQDFVSLDDRYVDRIVSDVFLSGEPKVVIDAGNGASGALGPRLFEELGCQVIPLFCEIDGNFPNHDPDPSIDDNLKTLVATVKENRADLGLAFDGDADRVVIVSNSGKIIAPDQLLMMLAKDIVSRNPGADVLFDVKCSRALSTVISAYGGRPVMWKSGHSYMKAKMRETGALLGGEYSGHIFIKERWYGFDDGLYAAARVLEIMSLREQDLDSILENFPVPPSSPEIKIPVPEADKFAVVEELIAHGNFGQGRANTIDGLRVDFAKSWGLVRVSNTSPALTLRFEAESEADLAKTIALFKRELAKVRPQLALDF